MAKKTGKNGAKTWKILTIGNVIVDLKLPYVVERKTRKDYQNKPKGQGFCPFLRWLGLEKKVTPLVWSTVAEYGTMRSSFETAQLTLKDWGIALTIRKIQSLTYFRIFIMLRNIYHLLRKLLLMKMREKKLGLNKLVNNLKRGKYPY